MTREDIIRMARETFDVTTDGRGRETFSGDSFGIERFAALVSEREREACARVCDTEFWNATKRDGSVAGVAAGNCAAAIRARGQQ